MVKGLECQVKSLKWMTILINEQIYIYYFQKINSEKKLGLFLSQTFFMLCLHCSFSRVFQRMNLAADKIQHSYSGQLGSLISPEWSWVVAYVTINNKNLTGH